MNLIHQKKAASQETIIEQIIIGTTNSRKLSKKYPDIDRHYNHLPLVKQVICKIKQ